MRYLLLFFLLQPGLVQAQDQQAYRFIRFLNEYNTDSLAPLLAENFQWKRTFGSSGHDKRSFLENYIPVSKAYNAGFLILRTISPANPVQFLVEDKSDYLKYLEIPAPTWKLFITVKQDKIETVTVDTTASSKRYFEQASKKTEKFESWWDIQYPRERERNSDPGLLIRRLREFVRLEDTH
jgi:hypothetical protein